jgi:threonyl-tRNA synthetase
MRVRAFTQDDAHIFCTEDQIEERATRFIELSLDPTRTLGLTEVEVSSLDRPGVRAGSTPSGTRPRPSWLKAAAQAAGVEPVINRGRGRLLCAEARLQAARRHRPEWQCGTLQVDFNLPERSSAEYVGEDGSKHRPVMLHRAILGSFERFIGILIENYAGAFPLWLAPTQAVVATITSDADDYAEEVARPSRKAGLRVETDLRNEKVGYKIREHSWQKIPAIAVVGRQEAEDRTVAIRRSSEAQARARRIRRLKGFDGDFFLHVEDVDLCWRAREMGGVVLFHPTAEVVHLGHTSLVEPFFVEWFKGNGLARYFVKRADSWPRRVLAYGLGPIIVLASVARPLMRRLTGRS